MREMKVRCRRQLRHPPSVVVIDTETLCRLGPGGTGWMEDKEGRVGTGIANVVTDTTMPYRPGNRKPLWVVPPLRIQSDLDRDTSRYDGWVRQLPWGCPPLPPVQLCFAKRGAGGGQAFALPCLLLDQTRNTG